MRRAGLLVCLSVLLCVLTCGPFVRAVADEPAAARVEAVATTAGDNSVSYPQLVGLADEAVQRKINEDIVLSGDIGAYLLGLGRLGEGGFGLKVWYDAYLNDSLLSVAIYAKGQAANGRYMQQNVALTYRLDTGERLSATDLFADVPAAAAALETILQDTLADELSAYLENSQLVPLPTDQLYVNADGVTFFYPYRQFSLLSGYAGAAQFNWEELRPYLQSGPTAVAALAGYGEDVTLDELKATLAQGRVPRVPVALGESMTDVIGRYRLLRDPDYYPGGKFMQMEAPEFRMVTLLADGMTRDYSSAVVQGIRTRRIDQCGIAVGKTLQSEWRAILGEPNATLFYDESTAYDHAVPVGECDFYQMGEYTLQLFADSDGVLYAVQLAQSNIGG